MDAAEPAKPQADSSKPPVDPHRPSVEPSKLPVEAGRGRLLEEALQKALSGDVGHHGKGFGDYGMGASNTNSNTAHTNSNVSSNNVSNITSAARKEALSAKLASGEAPWDMISLRAAINSASCGA